MKRTRRNTELKKILELCQGHAVKLIRIDGIEIEFFGRINAVTKPDVSPEDINPEVPPPGMGEMPRDFTFYSVPEAEAELEMMAQDAIIESDHSSQN